MVSISSSMSCAPLLVSGCIAPFAPQYGHSSGLNWLVNFHWHRSAVQMYRCFAFISLKPHLFYVVCAVMFAFVCFRVVIFKLYCCGVIVSFYGV